MPGFGLGLRRVGRRSLPGGAALPFPGFSLALDFVNGAYQQGDQSAPSIDGLTGYSQAGPPTITPGTGFVVVGGENLAILNSIPAPTGEFTFLIVALAPPQNTTYYVAGTLDDGFTSNANAIEVSRSNAGNHGRVRGIVASATILDNAPGTGTPSVTTPAIAAGAEMRFGAYREGGLLKPILYGTKRTGTAPHTLATLDSVHIAHRMVAGAVNSPFIGGTIQKIFLFPGILTDLEIAAL